MKWSEVTSGPAVLGTQVLDMDPFHAVMIRKTDISKDSIAEVFDSWFDALLGILFSQNRRPSGPPFGVMTRDRGDTADILLGYPVDEALSTPVTFDDEVVFEDVDLPARRVAVRSHLGGIEGIRAAAVRFREEVEEAFERSDDYLTLVFVTDPRANTDPGSQRIDIALDVTFDTPLTTAAHQPKH